MEARAEANAQKRARVQRFVGTARVANSTLARIVEELRREPALLEDVRTRSAVDRSMRYLTEQISTSIEVPLIGGGTFHWVVASLPKLLKLLVERSQSFSNLMVATYARHRCTPAAPWRLVLAEDELTPGAILRLDNRRKTLGHYISFLEFGHKARKHTSAWMPLALCRSSQIKKIEGGTSGLQRALFRHMLLGDSNLRTTGFVLPIGEGNSPVLMFCTLGRTITDELGEKNLWSTRGASSTMPCFLCKNVCGMGDKAIAPFSDTGYLVDVSCPHVEKFDMHTSDEMWEKCDILKVLAGTLNSTGFQEAQRRLGMAYNSAGVLWDEELRAVIDPFAVNIIDGAHSLLCNGLAQRELSALFRVLGGIRVGFPEARQIMDAKWRTCQALGGPFCRNILLACFNDAREAYFKKNKDFAGGASEMIFCLPAVRFWLEVTPGLAAAIPAEMASLASLCKVLALYQRAKHGDPVAEQLRAALREHGCNKLAAYQNMEGIFVPKDHYIKHLPSQIERDGELVDTLVAERYHQLPKIGMESISHAVRFEETALGRTVALLMHTLEVNPPAFTTACVGSSNDVSDIFGTSATASNVIAVEGTRIATDDVVRIDGDLVLVAGGFIVEGCAVVCGWRLLPVRAVTVSACLHRRGDATELFPADQVFLVGLWSIEDDGHVLIVE